MTAPVQDDRVCADRWPATVRHPDGSVQRDVRAVLTPHELVVLRAAPAGFVVDLRVSWRPADSIVPLDTTPWRVATDHGDVVVEQGAGCRGCSNPLGHGQPWLPWRRVNLPSTTRRR